MLTWNEKLLYPKGYDTNTVDRISTLLADVDNVSDSRVIIHGNSIIVVAETEGQNTQRVEQDVRRTVANMAGNRENIVVTDKEQYNQNSDWPMTDFRAGDPFESLGKSMNEMFHDFKRATNRPAQTR
ncbi:YhcN/YlaJ family sporulation lipoprotein [Anaerobacillus sp. HL2]|nr:YhcN/YlaJ family sporulation lipoprotein [Anaerobacillus sp. HL2]